MLQNISVQSGKTIKEITGMDEEKSGEWRFQHFEQQRNIVSVRTSRLFMILWLPLAPQTWSVRAVTWEELSWSY